MTRLSAQTIKRLAIFDQLVSPFREQNLQPCSYDLSVDAAFDIAPGEFKLISTYEWVKLPYHISGKVEGRSSMGRKGVFVIVASGFVDAGFEGNLTLECFNASAVYHHFEEDLRVAQIVFDFLDEPTQYPYKGRYQFQQGVTPSRL